MTNEFDECCNFFWIRQKRKKWRHVGTPFIYQYVTSSLNQSWFLRLEEYFLIFSVFTIWQPQIWHTVMFNLHHWHFLCHLLKSGRATKKINQAVVSSVCQFLSHKYSCDFTLPTWDVQYHIIVQYFHDTSTIAENNLETIDNSKM